MIPTPMLTASIGDVVSDAWNTLMEPVGSFFDFLLSISVVKWLGTLLHDLCLAFLTWSGGVYDKLVNRAYTLLTQSPKDWSPDAWSLISNINDALISTIGITLIVVFFAIGFCKNSLEPHRELRIETILMMFIKLSVASWFMYNSIYIVSALFGLVGIVAGENSFANGSESLGEFFEAAYNTVTNNGAELSLSHLGSLLVVTLVTLAYTGASIGIGAAILYQSFTRFFKIFIIVPYGSIASTTLAGDSHLSQTAASFYKYALNCILEAATMLMAMYVYSKLATTIPEGLGLYADPAASLMDVCGRMVREIILMATLHGVIKQSSEITRRALGL